MAQVEKIGLIAMNIYTTRCIGSACMAWRWDKKPIKKGDIIPQYTGEVRGNAKVCEMLPAEEDMEGQGHCGLAGHL